ncbi:uncharacterized protein KY384_005434 [Bacidia gigantensis]|uniref:uncharacterized protein n=1 Tax=Bacidia gigantensis TaxID=2732470 RepID=UPI001D04A339|nr:uncharacterized protein KY384_005434 [Bacidia gigantensis]KAG8529953.1 hypothetical protein KY384_005434 [Bacidia gigantensis]
MSQTTIPRTPTPEPLLDDDLSSIASPTRSKSPFSGSHSRLSAIMTTPPPSTQIPNPIARPLSATSFDRGSFHSHHHLRHCGWNLRYPPELYLAKYLPWKRLKVRSLLSELLPALGEARITAAHSKLQHSLLTIETEESKKRAEVEHEATKREVQVLQENSPAPAHVMSPIASPQTPSQRTTEIALSHCRDLQRENGVLEKRLKASKKLIARLDSKNADLTDHIQLLRQRIKDNRNHMNDLQDRGIISLTGTPRHEFATPNNREPPRTPATRRLAEDIGSRQTPSQTPFDTLLQAANLNSAGFSVPSSPSQQRQRGVHSHMRGTHSLSSLPTTPQRRPVTAEATMTGPSGRFEDHKVNFSASGTQSRPQDDRESTISASDNEDNLDDEDGLPGSQASQVASQMLRRTLEGQNSHRSPLKEHLSPSPMRQSKLFGHTKKPGTMPLKRPADDDVYDDSIRKNKLQKTAHRGSDRIGLGIGSWPSPG